MTIPNATDDREDDVLWSRSSSEQDCMGNPLLERSYGDEETIFGIAGHNLHPYGDTIHVWILTPESHGDYIGLFRLEFKTRYHPNQLVEGFFLQEKLGYSMWRLPRSPDSHPSYKPCWNVKYQRWELLSSEIFETSSVLTSIEESEEVLYLYLSEEDRLF